MSAAFERWSSADMLALLVQLGAVPPPPAGGVTRGARPAPWE
jgi:hypothetical protein